jgi:hypothetical protein
LWDLDSSGFWVIINILKSLTFKSSLLHFKVVEGTDGVEVWFGSKLLKEVLSVIEVEDFLDAIEMLSNVVLVGKDSKRFVNLILHTNLILLIINKLFVN